MPSNSENESLQSSKDSQCAEEGTITELDEDSVDNGDGVTDIKGRHKVKFNDTSGTGGSGLSNIPQNTIPNSRGSQLQQRKKQQQTPVTRAMIIGVPAIIVGCLGCLCLYLTQDTEKGCEQSLQKGIRHIRAEFPSQLDNIWAAFSAGIKETAQGTPTKPSVFLLLYETEEGTPICLAQKMGKISTCFLNAVKLHPLLIIQGADLQHNETLAEDYGVLLEEYRPKVEEQRTMIVNNLHKIPGTVAQSFHSFCDTVTPVVAKAVYFFTMKASGVTANRDNPTAVAEEELRKLWSDKLDEDMLNPLITRITDTTMMIKPEKNLAPCES